ncbi:permease [Natronomonas salina]|uniref:DUF7139 domain-containing protein n=1 Tax=Natronomonas salina TaxID=1710540 RepID=UPI0015B70F9B|nr:permease [Natronomonas salina]QLD88021.1 permease [Natronomonas salina]
MSTSESNRGTDRLVDVYRAYIGEPDSRTDVYLGFALFFAGLGLGLAGLLLFAIERGVIAGEAFWLREIAFAGGALGLPVLLVSVVVLLPADRRAVYVALGGLAITVVAIGFFVSVYPSNWNYGADYSLQGVSVYAVGLISLLAATGSALVGYHIERVGGGPAAAAGAEEEQGGDDPEVTAAQVQRDIDEAMSGTEMSWGGVEKVETERLSINPDADLDGHNFDQSKAKVHRSKSVDDQLSALKGMKGGEQRTDSGSGVDDQADALKQLREQQRKDAEADPDGLVGRLKDLVGR